MRNILRFQLLDNLYILLCYYFSVTVVQCKSWFLYHCTLTLRYSKHVVGNTKIAHFSAVFRYVRLSANYCRIHSEKKNHVARHTPGFSLIWCTKSSIRIQNIFLQCGYYTHFYVLPEAEGRQIFCLRGGVHNFAHDYGRTLYHSLYASWACISLPLPVITSSLFCFLFHDIYSSSGGNVIASLNLYGNRCFFCS